MSTVDMKEGKGALTTDCGVWQSWWQCRINSIKTPVMQTGPWAAIWQPPLVRKTSIPPQPRSRISLLLGKNMQPVVVTSNMVERLWAMCTRHHVRNLSPNHFCSRLQHALLTQGIFMEPQVETAGTAVFAYWIWLCFSVPEVKVLHNRDWWNCH